MRVETSVIGYETVWYSVVLYVEGARVLVTVLQANISKRTAVSRVAALR